MTSEEIVKALRLCAKSDCSSCGMCPIFPDRECVEHLATAAASLIEQLIDENTELREEVNLRGNAVRTYEKKRAEAEAERDALREKQRWIPVAERLPEPETDVLAVCNRNGYIFVIPAIYEDGKMLTQDSAWNWSDIYCYGLYDEDADDYYIPEGWWENRQFNPDDVYNNPVDCVVTHWMPLPEAPKEGGKA